MDEPTGNLDPGAAEQILSLIDRLSRSATASFVVVTHDADIAAHMDRVYELIGGQLSVRAEPTAGGIAV